MKGLREGNIIYNKHSKDGFVVDGVIGRSVYVIPFIPLGRSSPITSLRESQVELMPITEDNLINLLGYSYLNGQTSGTLTRDFYGKLDIDFINGVIQLKSHYEGDYMYRSLPHIKYVHQLQNLFYDLSGEEITDN